MVKSSASRGAILCHITCVSGLPCRSSKGGPRPPWRRLMRAPAASIEVWVKPSNIGSFRAARDETTVALLTQETGQLAPIGELIDAPHGIDHRLRLLCIQSTP